MRTCVFFLISVLVKRAAQNFLSVLSFLSVLYSVWNAKLRSRGIWFLAMAKHVGSHMFYFNIISKFLYKCHSISQSYGYVAFGTILFSSDNFCPFPVISGPFLVVVGSFPVIIGPFPVLSDHFLPFSNPFPAFLGQVSLVKQKYRLP